MSKKLSILLLLVLPVPALYAVTIPRLSGVLVTENAQAAAPPPVAVKPAPLEARLAAREAQLDVSETVAVIQALQLQIVQQQELLARFRVIYASTKAAFEKACGGVLLPENERSLTCTAPVAPPK